jgi:hypothetical protein
MSSNILFVKIKKTNFKLNALGHRNVWFLIRHFNVFTFRGPHLHRISLLSGRRPRILLPRRLGLQPCKIFKLNRSKEMIKTVVNST